MLLEVCIFTDRGSGEGTVSIVSVRLFAICRLNRHTFDLGCMRMGHSLQRTESEVINEGEKLTSIFSSLFMVPGNAVGMTSSVLENR